MSSKDVGCFGKLPFALLEQLQRQFVGRDRYWADAIKVDGTEDGLMTIDSISLDPNRLSKSVGLAILHSMNDIFAANGMPSSFSVSLSLPAETDLDGLTEINSEISKVASLTDTQISKIHTSRAAERAVATVATYGRLVSCSDLTVASGAVWLIGDYSSELVHASDEWTIRSILDRRNAVTRLCGPKKDVSGDGFAGSLCQLARRNDVDVVISSAAIRSERLNTAAAISERSYLDYATQINGLSRIARSQFQRLFSARVFGPLLCLANAGDATGLDGLGEIIGTFKSGGGTVGVVES